MSSSLLLRTKQGKIGAMTVKINLKKAFDFISWDYIKIVLHGFGFNNYWINLILECISSSSFSILINGKMDGYFYPSGELDRGILSPLPVYSLYGTSN